MKSKKQCARFFEIRIANHAPLSLRLNLDRRLKEKEFATTTAAAAAEELTAATVVAAAGAETATAAGEQQR